MSSALDMISFLKPEWTEYIWSVNPLWFVSGFLITFVFPAALNSPWKNNIHTKMCSTVTRKAAFLFMGQICTELCCCAGQCCISSLEMIVQAIWKSRRSWSFVLLLYRSSATLLFLTFCTFTHIYSGAKPTQSARGSPQGKFWFVYLFKIRILWVFSYNMNIICHALLVWGEGFIVVRVECVFQLKCNLFFLDFSMKNTQVSFSWVMKCWNPRNEPIQMKDMLNQTRLNGKTSQVTFKP